MKKLIFLISLLIIIINSPYCYEPKLHFNPWELIIYRPENSEKMNQVRCWLKAEDENGNDITFTKIKATYQWVTIPDTKYNYKNKYFLEGGMAMHLNLQPGKYKFSVYTPMDKHYPYYLNEKKDWTSNIFIYDTENPLKVIFVYPTASENGFYNGGWVISSKAPDFYKVTKPKISQ